MQPESVSISIILASTQLLPFPFKSSSAQKSGPGYLALPNSFHFSPASLKNFIVPTSLPSGTKIFPKTPEGQACTGEYVQHIPPETVRCSNRAQ